MTTAKKAPATKKAAPRKKVKLADKIEPEVREELVKAIMDFPEGCVEGKIQFLAQHGFPIPPQGFAVNIYGAEITLPNEMLDPNGDGTFWPTVAATKAIAAAITDGLQRAGFAPGLVLDRLDIESR